MYTEEDGSMTLQSEVQDDDLSVRNIIDSAIILATGWMGNYHWKYNFEPVSYVSCVLFG